MAVVRLKSHLTIQGVHFMAEKPEYIAYAVRNFEKDGEKKSRWLEIGAAWKSKDGEGFTINLDAVPVVDGRIVLRKNAPKPE
jgi:hypothetical protein